MPETQANVSYCDEDFDRAFDPPPFQPHRFWRGGHLQTIATLAHTPTVNLQPTQQIVPLSDGDSLVLHYDQPEHVTPDTPTIVLLHGLSGCHAAPYMIRLAGRFVERGLRVVRMDLRGCGAGSELASNVTHAGRSEDVIRALDAIAQRIDSGPLMAAGVSLGGQQLMLTASRIGAGLDAEPFWYDRLVKIAAVAPPIDLQRCSDSMTRAILRPYNFYFIRALVNRAPAKVRERPEFVSFLQHRRPKTLQELDDRLTAPLSGFDGARDYYAQASSHHWVQHNSVRTLLLAANDDPIVPVECFTDRRDQFHRNTTLHLVPTGGHTGFVDRSRRSWMDEALVHWFAD